MTSTIEAIGLPFQEAIDFFGAKVPEATRHWTDVWKEAHTRAFMVAGAASDALLADFQAAVRKAVGEGMTLAQFRGEFDAIVERHGWVYNGGPAWRSRIIYETNVAMAHAAGRYVQMIDPDVLEAFPYWEYEHTTSIHPRVDHLQWVGITLRADSPWWATHYPPNGWRCHCGVRPVSEPMLRRMGKSGPDEAPPIEYVQWRNPHTGEMHLVPQGISPGFDYNVGQAWQRGAPPLPPGAPPVPPAPPLPPGPRIAATVPEPPASAPGAPFRPLATEDIGAADAHLTEAMRPWADGLSEAERQAIDDYKGLDGFAINAVLRGERAAPTLEGVAATISAALMRSHAPMDLRLLRGVGEQEAAVLAALMPGDVWEPPDFKSTTLSAEVAAAFAKAGTVEIRVRAGQSGVAYVHPFPRYRFPQFEVLLNRRSRYMLVGRSDHRWVLELRDDHRE
jgi:hypothetical protein